MICSNSLPYQTIPSSSQWNVQPRSFHTIGEILCSWQNSHWLQWTWLQPGFHLVLNSSAAAWAFYRGSYTCPALVKIVTFIVTLSWSKFNHLECNPGSIEVSGITPVEWFQLGQDFTIGALDSNRNKIGSYIFNYSLGGSASVLFNLKALISTEDKINFQIYSCI